MIRNDISRILVLLSFLLGAYLSRKKMINVPGDKVMKRLHYGIKTFGSLFVLDTIVYLIANDSPLEMVAHSTFDKSDFNDFILIEYGCLSVVGLVLFVLLLIVFVCLLYIVFSMNSELIDEYVDKVADIGEKIINKFLFVLFVAFCLSLWHASIIIWYYFIM